MIFGPILFLRAVDDTRLRLAALVCRDGPDAPEALCADGTSHAPGLLAEIAGKSLWRYDFSLPRGAAADYSVEGHSYTVATDLEGDLRIGFVSCNGEEEGDLSRDPEERDAMWRRMAETHEAAPYHLLLHGGDQVYADEVTHGNPLSDHWPDEVPSAATPEAVDELRRHLREAFLDRYCVTYAGKGFAHLAARVPSLMMWDDHDICDGWGSLGAVEKTAVGETLFACAREAFLLYQNAAVDADVPELFTDPSGTSLSWRRDLPGVSVIAPDLRSERTRSGIMGDLGWTAFRRACEGLEARVVMVSSVPLLGPRLSLIERVMRITKRMEKYEDDLRDQWQSYAHRTEWQRMLRSVAEARGGGPPGDRAVGRDPPRDARRAQDGRGAGASARRLGHLAPGPAETLGALPRHSGEAWRVSDPGASDPHQAVARPAHQLHRRAQLPVARAQRIRLAGAVGARGQRGDALARGLTGTALPLPERAGFLTGLSRIETRDPALSLVLAHVAPDRFSEAEFAAHGFAAPRPAGPRRRPDGARAGSRGASRRGLPAPGLATS